MNAAAQKLNVTGALIGQRIAALEDHLQSKLLTRTTRQHHLTEFGQGYLEQCQDILDLVAVSEGRAEDQKERPSGHLRIAAPTSFGTEALMPALKDFCAIAPDVKVEVALSDHNHDLIADGIDIAFRIGALEDSSLMQVALAPYQMMLCAAPAYIAIHGRPSVPQDLNQHQAVLFTKTSRRPWRLTKGAEALTWAPKATVSVNSGQAVRVAVREGMGIAMLPKVLIHRDLEEGRLRQLLADWRLPEQPMSLIYHRDRYMPRRMTLFLDFAKKTFARP